MLSFCRYFIATSSLLCALVSWSALPNIKSEKLDTQIDSRIGGNVLYSNADGSVMVVARNEQLVIVDGKNNKILFSIKPQSTQKIIAAALSLDGQKTLLATDNCLEIWDNPSLTMLVSWSLEEKIQSLSWNNDATQILLAYENNPLAHVVNSLTGSIDFSIAGHSQALRSLSYSPDGELILSASKDGSVQLREAATGALKSIWPAHGKELMSAQFAPQGQSIYTASLDGTIRQWSLQGTLENINSWRFPKRVVSARFSNNARLLIALLDDGHYVVWRIGRGSLWTSLVRNIFQDFHQVLEIVSYMALHELLTANL